MLSAILHPASGLWMLGKIEDHTAKPLTREEIEMLAARENAPRPDPVKLRNLVANIAAVPCDKDWSADNLAVALCTYFSKHPCRPTDDENDEEAGWGKWVVAQTNDALDRIVKTAREG